MEVIAILPHLWIIPTVTLGLVLICAAIAVLGVKFGDGYDWGIAAPMGTIFGAMVVLVGGIMWAVMLIPYDSKYHVYYSVEGTVEDVTRTFEDGTGELTGLPVVTLSTLDEPIIVNQSRIYSYVGEDVKFTCSLSWVAYGQDYLDCFIAGTSR